MSVFYILVIAIAYNFMNNDSQIAFLNGEIFLDRKFKILF